jgi:8-oxo-dGTP diphosphatase / 2-hydroxy-dATP diphosphatase
MKKIMTLVLVHQGNKLLLGMKKRGFGQGRWNGFGGKLQPGESVEDAAERELIEEVSITPLDMRKRGVITFHFENDPVALEVHFFSVSEFTGTPTEGEEMKPQWYSTDKIPFEHMWPDDPHWMPLFLAGKNFGGDVYFKDSNTILRHTIKEE